MLGRARRAVLAVAGTAEGMFGERSRRAGRGSAGRRHAQTAPPRPEPTAGLPPGSSASQPPACRPGSSASRPPACRRASSARRSPSRPRRRARSPVEPDPAEPARHWEPPRLPRTPQRGCRHARPYVAHEHHLCGARRRAWPATGCCGCTSASARRRSSTSSASARARPPSAASSSSQTAPCGRARSSTRPSRCA